MRSETTMTCIDAFTNIYHHEPLDVIFCPYRVCPIGAHIDHQYGKITGFAIDKGIHIAYSPNQNGVIELVSLNFTKQARFHIREISKEKQNDWTDYLRGAAWALNQTHPLSVGICAIIEGGLPIGGLSSSAALIIAFLSALCKVNQIDLSENEMILTALDAENKYVGVSCGKLDQSCEIYSKKGHLLYLDTENDSYELIPTNPNMKPCKIAVFFSGIERTLISSKFNMRVEECKGAAYALMSYSRMDLKLENVRLRSVPYEIYLKFKNKLPENFRKRAEHFYSESERVEKGVLAWRKGDIESFGQLSFESGRSSIDNYETGSPELKTLYDIMLKTDGIYGGRFSGAGFKGCCMGLIDPSFEEYIKERVTSEYVKVFPELKNRYSFHVCENADGFKM